jgi:protein TonB
MPPAPPQEEQEAKAPPKVSPDVVRKWQMTVNTRLNQYKRYPAQARARHHEGRVIVAFTLDTEGHVVNSKIVKSSGSAILDQETLDLITRAQPYPVPPNGAGGQDLFLQVPIAYGLQ